MILETATPLIEKVTIAEVFPYMAAKDWARITGEEPGYQGRSFYYRAIESGEEYQEIVGGFCAPGPESRVCRGRRPGPAG
jgi:hypothetical protein